MNAAAAKAQAAVDGAGASRAEPDVTGTIRQRVTVDFDFPVSFTRGVFDPANPLLADTLGRREPGRCQRVAVVIDAGVAAAWPGLTDAIRTYAAAHAGRMILAGEPLAVPGGEASKNDPAVVAAMLAHLQGHGIDRHSHLLAIGGGAVLDAAGYAAAVCHRGVRLVRLPTTVLAQNDSGVGVKTAVNAFGSKNFLGTFTPPFAVVNDLDFLETLPTRDRRAGMAEAVKVAVIRDAAFFAWLEERAGALAAFEPGAMAVMIRRCAELHMDHIARGGDPFEMGNARPLDFGHWAAHRLEMMTGHALRHGEAVAIGMALDTAYAVAVGMLPAAAGERVLRLLEALGFRLWDSALDGCGEGGERLILRGLAEFREHLGGELSISLPDAVGRGVEVHAMDTAVIGAVLEDLRARDAAR